MVQVIFKQFNHVFIQPMLPQLKKEQKWETVSKAFMKGLVKVHYIDCFPLFFKTIDFNIDGSQIGQIWSNFGKFISFRYFLVCSMFGNSGSTYYTIFPKTEALDLWIFLFAFKEDGYNISFFNISFSWLMLASQLGWLALLGFILGICHQHSIESFWLACVTW